MKQLKIYGLLITLLCAFLTSCTHAQGDGTSKILIVYLSRTNNTKTIANLIHKQVGGDIVALELKTPYPKNYKAIVAQVAKENETGFLPVLASKVDIRKYDIIYLGFPTWGMQLPPPMKSFLKTNNLNEKTVIPFNSNAGYGIGSTFDTVKELSPNSKVLEGFTTKGGVEREGIFFVMEGDKLKKVNAEIMIWLKKIGQLK